jgi:uncharacterized glyoxalase superfamily protein PhnB
MKIAQAATVFQVTDIKAVIQWYVDVLGFKLQFEHGPYAGLERDGCFIHLSGGPDQKNVGKGYVYLVCDEVDEFHHTIAGRGASIAWGPRDQPYGMRDMMVNDPAGNTLYFGRITSCDMA